MKKRAALFLLCVVVVSVRAASAAPVISTNGVVNNASFAPGVAPLAPGTLAAIFGTGLNDGSQIPSSSFVNGRLVTTLGGASVTFNGIPAPMFSSFPTQLNVQVPLELAGANTAQVVVTVAGQVSNTATVNIAGTSPGIFAINNGFGAIQIANTTIFAASMGSIPGAQSRGANPGEFITIYATGLGAVNNPPATGEAASGNQTIATPQVTIGGVPARVSFSGMVPGFVALYQVNVEIPPNAPGSSFDAVALSIGGRQSNVVGMAVNSDVPGGPGANCNGFVLTGTGASVTGNLPGNCIFQLGNAATGAVLVSLAGRVENNQTVYSGTITGNGTAPCANGNVSPWTANLSLTIRLGTTVASLATSGGPILGNITSVGGVISFCGSTQLFNGLTLSSSIPMTGSVSPGGGVTLNAGGPGGNPPVVLQGNGQSAIGPIPGVFVTQILFGLDPVGGLLPTNWSATSTSSQTVYTGTGRQTSGTLICRNGSQGGWAASVSGSVTVSPAIATLTTSGGSVSGTWSAILSGGVLEPTCGPPQAIAQISGTVSGTVLAGGSVTLNLVCTSGCDGKSEDTVLTGTATSLTSSLLGGDVIGSSATGSVPISFTGTTSGNQTTYTGGGNGGGTVDCGAGVTGNWTGSLTGSVSLTPAIPSLAANGGLVSGTWNATFAVTACGQSESQQVEGTAYGIVSPGGAVMVGLRCSAASCD